MKVTTRLFLPIFAFWISMMSVLVSREYAAYSVSRGRSGYGRLLAGDFPYRDEWMEIYSGAIRIGYISYSVWDRSPEGYELSAHSVVRLPSLPGLVRLESTSLIDSEFKLEEISAKVVIPGLIDLSMEGAVCDDELALEIRSGGELLRMRMDPRRVLFTDIFTPLYSLDLNHVNEEKKAMVYDPLTGREEELLIKPRGRCFVEVAGRRTGAREFGVTFRSIDCTVFIDNKGRLLFMRGPDGFMVVNELLLGKGAGKELASLAVQNAECKLKSAK